MKIAQMHVARKYVLIQVNTHSSKVLLGREIPDVDAIFLPAWGSS